MREFLINGRDAGSYVFNNSVQMAVERDAKLDLNEMLNMVYKDICIEGCTIAAAEIFESCRPEEYRAMLRDRTSFIYLDAWERIKSGQCVHLGGNTYEIKSERE